MNYWGRFTFLLLASFVLTACSQPVPEEPQLSLQFTVAQNINPDDRTRPSPLVISLFELRSPDAFQQADLYSLYERPVEQLGADLVSKRRLRELVPGIDRTDHFSLQRETRYIGVLAEFVHYQQAKARIIVPVSSKMDNTLQINLAGTTLTLVQHENKKVETELQPVRM
ncbi:MAG TPA: type VI secretion system lipoprotein TssJ [Pseudomonadales bacterium]|nr:type VI secretion system lipoprotein TssJ [Pseudomonadales bacterium]